MAQVLIRGLSSEVVDKLKACARRNHRSLEAELRVILEAAVHAPAIDMLTEVERVRSLFAGRNFVDSTALEAHGDVEPNPDKPVFAEQMSVAEQIMREDQDTLRKLSE